MFETNLIRLLSTILLCYSANAFQYRYTIPRFSSSGLFTVDVNLNVDGYYLAGFGDFNGDFRTDIILLSQDKRMVRIYFWSLEKFGFSSDYVALSSESEILNIIPSDFDYDGRLDLGLLVKSDKGPDAFAFRVCFGAAGGKFENNCLYDATLLSGGQPMLVDYYGDRRVQLLSAQGDRVQALQVDKDSRSNRTFVSKEVLNSNICQFSGYHWNAFVDFNGDCIPDLFITCSDGSSRILVSKGGSYSESLRLEKIPDTKSILFSDFDGDGSVDIIILSCVNKFDCSIKIAYNQRDHIGLCKASDFKFDFGSFETDLSLNKLLEVEVDVNQGISSNFHTADINLDGYPDVLIVAELKNGHRKVFILENVPCDSLSSTGGKCSGNRRGFKLVTNGVAALSDLTNVKQAAFYDFSERGSFDLLVTVEDKETSKLLTIAFFNNFYNDAFFLKAMATNGVCYKLCSGNSGPKPLGTNYPGATFMYTVFDTHGTKRPAFAAQGAQYSYFSLTKPYVLVGLGRTNNYIEEFHVGISSGQSADNKYSWSGLMPNSQLLVHPPTSPSASSRLNEWVLELYLNPGDYALNVLVTLIISGAVLGVIVSVLRYQEKMTDRLPPNLLKLFTPRPPLNAAEPLDVDYGDRRCRRITGIGSFMKEFQSGFDKDYVPTDTDEQKRLYRLEKRKKDAEEAKKRQEQYWNPNKEDPNKSKDPFCTLFVAKIPDGTTDDDILAAFSVFGPLKGIKRVINSKNGKLRPYCFVEFEQEKDLEAVLERNDPVLIKNSRVILDVERGRTVRDWKPKRLGGGISSAPKKKSSIFSATSVSQYPSYSSSSNGQRRGYSSNAPPPLRRLDYDSGLQQNSRKRGYSPPRSGGSSATHDYKRGRY